jgi:hypothetical protein
MRSIPLITANPYPAASGKEEARAGGQRRGKPSVALKRHGPVTTDPFGRGSSPATWQIYGWGNTRALGMHTKMKA